MTLTDDVVERVARALYAACHEAEHGEVYENQTEQGREYWNTFARAALEAAMYGELVLEMRRLVDACDGLEENSFIGGTYARLKPARALLSTIGEPNPDLGATQP